MLTGLTFASLNPTIVSFNYFLGSREIALSLLLVFSFGVGLCLGLFIAVFPWLKAKTECFRLRSRLKVLEKEVENLRSMPIKDE
jgi:lipopolysaccharide assembly protein A